MSQVKVRDAFGNYSRVIFDGTEDDARKYIVDHFPRLHVEPGNTQAPEPDAVLDDNVSWDGVHWSDEHDEDLEPIHGDVTPFTESHAEESKDGVSVVDLTPNPAEAEPAKAAPAKAAPAKAAPRKAVK